MKSTSFLHHFGHCLYHSYIKIGRFYIISISSKNLPAKSLHRFYIIISDFYTIPTPKSEESTSFLYHSSIQYIIPISFFRFLYHFYIAKNFHSCRHYIIPISFFWFLYHCHIKKGECYINPVSLGLSRELSQQN